ncbi:hypothetical protein JET76_00540 [Pseudomonas putida]|uniref:hypothetical protein n=1 Tax=Pseudomonas TaxID=286 RepID=UPI0006D48537|nr:MULTISPECIES: hypothetical protein [Pseudomonas]MBI6939819.1 hypothetical protein [Pseudomonas putida]MBI6956211.1 hypothetical protein [Pseudomonas putida]PZQ41291.1 MAG: hypothetical protein DI560_06870 [Pseudomonas putida]
MRVFDASLTLPEQERLQGLAAWYRLLEDRLLRMECPDDYHAELARRADEMDRLGLISFREWRHLRVEAHRAYLDAVAGRDYPCSVPSQASWM